MTSQRSLRRHLTRAAFQALALMVVVALWAVVSHGQPRGVLPATRGQSAVDSPATLVTEHGCWSGAAPADMRGTIPGHVVVTRAGHAGPEYLGAAWVGPALDHVFNGNRPHLSVHAFCR